MTDARSGSCCPRCRAAVRPELRERVLHLPPTEAAGPGRPMLVLASTTYGGTSRRLLLAHKERGRGGLAGVLGELLAYAVLGAALRSGAASGATLLLVPVPSRPAARRARGAELGRELAARAAAVLRAVGWRVQVAPLLRHHRRSADQAGLGRIERERNLLDSLRVPRSSARGCPRDALLVLTDDILTTGATLREAARALRSAGLQPTAAAVVAATPRHRGSGSAAEGPLSPERAGG